MNDFESPVGNGGINNLKKALDGQDEKIRREKGRARKEAHDQEEHLKHDVQGATKPKKTEVTISAEKLGGLNLVETNVYFPRGPKGFAPYAYFEALEGNKKDEFIRELKVAVGVNKDVLKQALNFFVGVGLIHESVAEREVSHMGGGKEHPTVPFRGIPLFQKVSGEDPGHVASLPKNEHTITQPLFRFGAKGEFHGPLGTEVDYMAAKEFWGRNPSYGIAEVDATKKVGKLNIGGKVLSETNVAPFALGPVVKIGPVIVGISASPTGHGWKAYVRLHKKPH